MRFAIALSKITPQAIAPLQNHTTSDRTPPKSPYKRSHSQNHPTSDRTSKILLQAITFLLP
ncbi:MAG: hypothetical protein HEQ29_00595 [Dolichospermum sp. LBC05a]|nr:hypothetical protein [Dolichospermum sp. OL01]MCO5795359.1 hypothetical protein [Dolichospermum sp. OL03]MCS6281382.1 hypothetical protein [Dolichospermum sp.]QSV57079.1 MAG: hypothetical protein HEQ29_00595 [Dolichospermum sp. LBC05a]